jgi:hypothetical protein
MWIFNYTAGWIVYSSKILLLWLPWLLHFGRIQDISVGIMLDFGLNSQGVIPGRGQEIFPRSGVSKLSLGPTQSLVQ